MTQEEKQLLLKDLCARLPYGVILHIEGTIGGNYLYGDSKLIGIHNGIIHVDNQTAYGNYEGFPLTIKTKPYLRPMSSMTEEERKIYIEISGHLCGEIVAKTMIDWLNANHFDYRGLIPMGLALEAPEDMYKIDLDMNKQVEQIHTEIER